VPPFRAKLEGVDVAVSDVPGLKDVLDVLRARAKAVR
jgi:hypothetical protein